MRRIAAVAAVAIAMSSAHAQQRYKAADPDAVYCYDMAQAKAQRGSSCHELASNQSFALSYIGGPDGEFNTIEQITGVNDARYAYISGLLVPSKIPDSPRDKCASSDVPPGGEIDRWIISKDGSVKLKRFLVTSKCVNGHLRSATKRLN
ncbi:hypothetical protein [Burkholderia anthina]|uniref:hypothetical protein n=1 Tax=Burkholderia anthina TaxID=179879 RepID=UPI00158C42D7|nr:hypothetical protein [Burkholderia anthina]